MHHDETGTVDTIEAARERGFWHVLITEFSYRGYNNVRSIDPLSPERLEFRFRVFELACAPSVLSQSNQNFDWIIIIDKRLSLEHRDRILQVIGHRQRTHLHEFLPTEDVKGSAWVKRYAPSNAKTLLTTLLDDDDTLPSNFVEAIQFRIIAAGPDLPCLMTFGYKSSLQWELIASRRAPLGYKCSWHRGNWVRSAGVSLLCQLQDDISVLALIHIFADLWFETEIAGALSKRVRTEWGDEDGRPEVCALVEKKMQEFRVRAHLLIDAALSWRDQTGGELFVELSASTGPVVMTNHFFNEMVFRLLEQKANRSPVTGPESFPNTVVNPQVLQRNLRFFGKRWRMYWRVLSQRAGAPPFGTPRLGRIWVALWAGWRFMRI